MGRRCGFRYEKRLRALGVVRIAGIDEAGRGALAGPVVAAAVILPEKFRHRKLKDSKQLLPELRQRIYDELLARSDAFWSIGVVDSIEIDAINILRATHKAMRLALDALAGSPEHVLIDGLPVTPFPLPQTAIIDGDCISLSIAAASVIAKVTRDRLMREFCARFPEYCFSRHKGYGTGLHLMKLHEHGPCPIHRRSFEPVAQPLLALEFVRCRRRSEMINADADDNAVVTDEVSSKSQASNNVVIPSEVEGSRCATSEVNSTGSFDSAALRSG